MPGHPALRDATQPREIDVALAHLEPFAVQVPGIAQVQVPGEQGVFAAKS